MPGILSNGRLQDNDRQNVSVICGMPNSEDRVRSDSDRSANQLLVHVARHKYVVKERKASLGVSCEEQPKMEIEL